MIAGFVILLMIVSKFKPSNPVHNSYWKWSVFPTHYFYFSWLFDKTRRIIFSEKAAILFLQTGNLLFRCWMLPHHITVSHITSVIFSQPRYRLLLKVEENWKVKGRESYKLESTDIEPEDKTFGYDKTARIENPEAKNIRKLRVCCFVFNCFLSLTFL